MLVKTEADAVLLFTSFRVLQVVFDIFHGLVHLLLTADIQLDYPHAI